MFFSTYDSFGFSGGLHRELEKIEMIRRADGVYALDHAVTATQKEILAAFGLDENFVKENAAELSGEIAQMEKEVSNED